MWNKTLATELLNIKYPIIQGPFGGRFSSVKLLSTVSNLGGLGSFGFNAYHPDEIREVVQHINLATNQPYNLNLWVPLENDPAEDFDEEALRNWRKHYAAYFEEMGLPMPELAPLKKPAFEDQLAAVIEVAPPVASFIFGLPPDEVLLALKKSGTTILGTATTLEEAMLIDERPVDMIVVTGQEAGGHRPSFMQPAENSLHLTESLVRAVVARVGKPVIAAGGISNGEKAMDYLKLGAAAVQVGTAFLATHESGATPHHRQQLTGSDLYQTELTRAYSGRLARTIANSFTADYMAQETPVYAPYPIQSELLSELIKHYREHNLMDRLPLWAGHPSAALEQQSAAELFGRFVSVMDGLAEDA